MFKIGDKVKIQFLGNCKFEGEIINIITDFDMAVVKVFTLPHEDDLIVESDLRDLIKINN
jgi:hypothetical protein